MKYNHHISQNSRYENATVKETVVGITRLLLCRLERKDHCAFIRWDGNDSLVIKLIPNTSCSFPQTSETIVGESGTIPLNTPSKNLEQEAPRVNKPVSALELTTRGFPPQRMFTQHNLRTKPCHEHSLLTNYLFPEIARMSRTHAAFSL